MTTDKKTDARKLDHATLEVMRLRAIEATARRWASVATTVPTQQSGRQQGTGSLKLLASGDLLHRSASISS